MWKDPRWKMVHNKYMTSSCLIKPTVISWTSSHCIKHLHMEIFDCKKNLTSAESVSQRKLQLFLHNEKMGFVGKTNQVCQAYTEGISLKITHTDWVTGSIPQNLNFHQYSERTGEERSLVSGSCWETQTQIDFCRINEPHTGNHSRRSDWSAWILFSERLWYTAC